MSNPLPSRGNTQPSQASSTESVSFQRTSTAEVIRNAVVGISKCQTIGALLKEIPVPAQNFTKAFFDQVYKSFQKRGAAFSIVQQWKDALTHDSFANVPALNSLKAPIVQTCIEARNEDASIEQMTFDTVLLECKRTALRRMLEIKTKETEALEKFTETEHLSNELTAAWQKITRNELNSDHYAFLESKEIRDRVVKTLYSICENAFERTFEAKKKRQKQKLDADIEMTDVSGTNQKQVMSLIEEALKRKEQSRRDKALSGKGNRRAGPPKKQNQKNKQRSAKRVTKRVKTKTKTRVQQKRR